jgi:hypothetical protein
LLFWIIEPLAYLFLNNGVMDIKIFYGKEKENFFLQSPMSNVYCLMSVFQRKPLPTSPERRGDLLSF